MKKTVFFLFFIVFTKVLLAQPVLSNQAKVSVLTVGPGSSLNDAFGHSAFRIQDTVNNIDLVFGYGEYNFNTPNFYLKFAKGQLNYLISKDNFDRFLAAYTYFDRTIKEQDLNFSQVEKQKLFNFLSENYKPENRAYLYEFFFDNCATKIRDVAIIASNDRIIFNTPENFKQKTFRNLIHDNLNKNSWGSLGIDLALGSVIDRKATPEEHMFLPENIYVFFENATFKNNKEPLVQESRTLYKQKNNPSSGAFILSPLFVFGILGFFILYITYKDHLAKKQTQWLDVALFVFTGITGVLVLLLWFATDHTGTHQNYNLLWAFALNLFMIPQLLKQKTSQWFIKYLKLLIILLCLLTLHWLIGVQVFAIGLIPFLIALFIRYLYLIKHFNKHKTHP